MPNKDKKNFARERKKLLKAQQLRSRMEYLIQNKGKCYIGDCDVCPIKRCGGPWEIYPKLIKRYERAYGQAELMMVLL